MRPQFGQHEDDLGPAQQPAVPRAGLPAKHTLDYLKVGIEVLLLLLAIPWLLKQLLAHPGDVSHQAAAHHLKGG